MAKMTISHIPRSRFKRPHFRRYPRMCKWLQFGWWNFPAGWKDK